VFAPCSHAPPKHAEGHENRTANLHIFAAFAGLISEKPSQGLEPWTPSLPFESPRRNRRVRMTPQVPQIQANRANERQPGFPRLDTNARFGVRTVRARGWSAGMAGSGSLRCRLRCASRPPRSDLAGSSHYRTGFSRRSSSSATATSSPATPTRSGSRASRSSSIRPSPLPPLTSTLPPSDVKSPPTCAGAASRVTTRFFAERGFWQLSPLAAGQTRQLDDLRGQLSVEAGAQAACGTYEAMVLSGLLAIWGGAVGLTANGAPPIVTPASPPRSRRAPRSPAGTRGSRARSAAARRRARPVRRPGRTSRSRPSSA
jgi:hypothetical protein